MSDDIATAERDLPKPGYQIVSKTIEERRESGDSSVDQWHVKLKDKHLVRIVGEVVDGKVRPPQFGATDYVLVTQRRERIGDRGIFVETSVYGSDANGKFFNAPMYIAPLELIDVENADLTLVMFALGEI